MSACYGKASFSDNNGEEVGRITPAGAISVLRVPGGISPGAITTGPDGNLYFAGSSRGAGIGRITTGGVITAIAVPASGGIAAGPDGNIWLTEDGNIAQLVLTKPATASPPVAATPASVSSPPTATAASTQGTS